ncbi:MAG: hypothetical protein K2P78_02670 [Gemmataceae bacterium]|nr:hypothetical protein [Gemmataceae bacterium]
MTTAYVMTGTLTDGKTVQLDEPLPLLGGKVRVTVEFVPPDATAQPWRQVLERIWEDQRRRGHAPRSAEEIQAQIREERESWGD